MTPKTVLLDTNLLIDDEKIIFKLAKEYDQILIPLTVLKELDKHKYDRNLSYSARNAIRAIRDFKWQFPDKIKFSVNDEELNHNDTLIINAGKEYNAVLATKDISMSTIAEAKGLQTRLYDVVLNNIFEPYNYLTLEKLYENNELFNWHQIYSKKDYDFLIKEFNIALEKQLNENSWFFVFIQGSEEQPYIYANNPIKKQLVRIDNTPKYKEVTIQNQKIKALDIYQNCALFIICEAPHCLITGRWGSGKSLLVTGKCLELTKKKIFITRPPIGINQKYDLGFFPGTKEDKMMDWLSGFTSSLYYIYGNTKGQLEKNNGYNYVIDTLFHKHFEIMPLNSIQGLSLLEDDILLVDESQLINVDYMSMLLSRPSEGGKLILMGDLKQTYDIVKPSESGLLKLLRSLPHRSLAYVELKNSYRSDLIELADTLQDRSL